MNKTKMIALANFTYGDKQINKGSEVEVKQELVHTFINCGIARPVNATRDEEDGITTIDDRLKKDKAKAKVKTDEEKEEAETDTTEEAE